MEKAKQMNKELRRLLREHDRLYKTYRHIYEYAPVGYFIMGADDKSIIEANIAAANLLQLKRSDIIGTEFTKYLTPEFVDAFIQCVKKALRSFEQENCEVKLHGRDGSIWVFLEIYALKDDPRVYITALDITQKKEENAVMENQIEVGIKKNRELSSQLLLVQEEERQNLAIDIHNNIGQSLTLLNMQINRLRKLPPGEIGPILDEIDMQSREIVQQIRDISNTLSMHMLKDLGLLQALQNYIKKVEETTSLKVNFLFRGLETQLNRIVEISVFHIIQEAITNVLRHSNANEVDISIEVVSNVLNLHIEDKGCGFVPDSDKLNSIGMKGMRERAEVLGAKWTVESSPGNGTLLSGEFPLPS